LENTNESIISKELWVYVNGESVKPTLTDDNSNKNAVKMWIKNDNKAKSDIILLIHRN